MNDYQMTHLASDRLHDLRAEADRQRLARSARGALVQRKGGSVKPARIRRLSLSLRFGRTTA